MEIKTVPNPLATGVSHSAPLRARRGLGRGLTFRELAEFQDAESTPKKRPTMPMEELVNAAPRLSAVQHLAEYYGADCESE